MPKHFTDEQIAAIRKFVGATGTTKAQFSDYMKTTLNQPTAIHRENPDFQSLVAELGIMFSRNHVKLLPTPEEDEQAFELVKDGTIRYTSQLRAHYEGLGYVALGTVTHFYKKYGYTPKKCGPQWLLVPKRNGDDRDESQDDQAADDGDGAEVDETTARNRRQSEEALDEGIRPEVEELTEETHALIHFQKLLDFMEKWWVKNARLSEASCNAQFNRDPRRGSSSPGLTATIAASHQELTDQAAAQSRKRSRSASGK